MMPRQTRMRLIDRPRCTSTYRTDAEDAKGRGGQPGHDEGVPLTQVRES